MVDFMLDEEKRREYNRRKTKEWKEKNQTRWTEIQKQCRRRRCITTTNGHLWGTKRPYPENGCELCNRIGRLHYHHYDDNDLRKGIWVCFLCHKFVERVEKAEGIVEKYSKLKNEVCN